MMLTPWKEVMTNLDSVLKSRDITLPAKVRLVKAMIFPVVMHGCESWTIKKAECRRIEDFELLFVTSSQPIGGGNGNPLQDSCLENSMDRGPWQATVHGVGKESDTTERLNNNNNLFSILIRFQY